MSSFQPRKNPYVVLTVLTLATMLTTYVEAMVIPSLPYIESALSANDEEAAWIVSAFLVVGAAVSPLFGKMGDIFGKKSLFMVSLLVYSVAVLAAGFSPNVYYLIAARAVQGFGFSLFPLSIAIITEVFPKDKVAMAQGIISATMAIGMTVGMIVGAYIEAYLGWRDMFHLAFILSVAMMAISYFSLDQYPPKLKEKIDYLSTAFLALGIALVLVYLTESPYRGWLSSAQIATLLSGIALFAAFVWHTARVSNPILSLGVLKRRNVMVANLAGLFSGTIMFTLYLGVIYYAEEVPPYGLGLTVLEAALTLLPATLAMMFIAPLVGSATTNLGPKPVLLYGSLVAALGFWMFIFDRGGTMQLAIDSFVTGVGIVSLMVPIVNMIAVFTPSEEVAVGLGFNTMMRYLGASLGPVLAATIMTDNKSWIVYSKSFNPETLVTEAGPQAFYLIFMMGIAFSVATLFVSFATHNYRPKAAEA